MGSKISIGTCSNCLGTGRIYINLTSSTSLSSTGHTGHCRKCNGTGLDETITVEKIKEEIVK